MTQALGKVAKLKIGNPVSTHQGRINTHRETTTADDPTQSAHFQPIDEVIEVVDASLNRRLDPSRRKTKVDATLEYRNARVPVIIADVSLRGMKVEIAEKIQLGTVVAVEVFGRKLAGTVRWCHLSHAGLYLLEDVDPELLRILEGIRED